MYELSADEQQEISEAAIYIRKHFKKENSTDLRNPFKIISLLDKYIIIRFPCKDKRVSGFSFKKGNYKCIYINSGDVLGRQYFSCWHEFYHCIDDLKNIEISFKNDKSKIEYKANYFAINMLLPEKDIKDYIVNKQINIKDIYEHQLISMQYNFRVSLDALIFRLNEIYNTSRFFKFKKINKLSEKENFIKKVRRQGLDIDLITPTNDFSIPRKFFKDLKLNMLNDRINIDKVEKIMGILEERGVCSKW